MKYLSSIGLIMVGLVAGLFMGGVANDPLEIREEDATPPRERPVGWGRMAGNGSALTGIARIRQSHPAELADLARMAVATADPVEGQRLLTECLLSMTTENWKEIVESIDSVTLETGRDSNEPWKLALFRGGQVAGEEAMNYYLPEGLKNRRQESWSVLYGWGTKDAHAALAWLRKAEADGNEISDDHYKYVIAGAALTNPSEALAMLADVPLDRRRGFADHYVWNTVQNGGTEALESVIQFASTLDPSSANEVSLSNELFDSAAERFLSRASHGKDVGQAYDVVVKLAELGRDPMRTTQQALRKLHSAPIMDKLELIERVSASSGGSDLDFSTLAATAMGGSDIGKGDVVDILEWIKEHPDSQLAPWLVDRVLPVMQAPVPGQ